MTLAEAESIWWTVWSTFVQVEGFDTWWDSLDREVQNRIREALLVSLQSATTNNIEIP